MNHGNGGYTLISNEKQILSLYSLDARRSFVRADLPAALHFAVGIYRLHARVFHPAGGPFPCLDKERVLKKNILTS